MTAADLPPRPWSYETHSRARENPGNGIVNVVDANGRKIAVLWGKPAEKIAMAELICAASEAP